ncbi:membrane trafficking protein, ER to Golgi Psg1 [Schizosaccharomyces pombe]|uniref:Uncharacterized protein C21C3.17c n=1 Tax=Schizosaccharomyces pombe (strain 972 / ATCC 24843) TaxID=284812 RepID=YOSH_SCHPO|nr:uncharacterized protein SPBC21C3.17c [Schizosaccharomyces pombe]Q9P7K7.1 RecName: Full=Uncharacterized protein C21C3.17c; Flags: Precursor [Schizosaccharomyces pombe 972h-]CAB76053.1 conserved fungal protein [Schizosaccharomyces pombe]|eukprot:NP_596597.1 uncharacterized protein SPBC21C3.17c [Schizosaccharomyces pombe]
MKFFLGSALFLILTFINLVRAEFEFITPAEDSRWARGFTYAVKWKQPTEQFVEIALQYADSNNTLITSSGVIPSNQTYWMVKIDKKWLMKMDNITARVVAVPQNGTASTVYVGPQVLLANTFYWKMVVDVSPAFSVNPIDKKLAIGLSVGLSCCILIVLFLHFATRRERRILKNEKELEMSSYRKH